MSVLWVPWFLENLAIFAPPIPPSTVILPVGIFSVPLTSILPVKSCVSSILSPNSVEPDEVAIIWLTNSVLNSFAIIEPEVEILPETCSEPVIPTFPATLNFSLKLPPVPIPIETLSEPPSTTNVFVWLFVSILKFLSS